MALGCWRGVVVPVPAATAEREKDMVDPGVKLVSPAGNKIAESLNSQAPGFVRKCPLRVNVMHGLQSRCGFSSTLSLCRCVVVSLCRPIHLPLYPALHILVHGPVVPDADLADLAGWATRASALLCFVFIAFCLGRCLGPLDS